MQHFSIIPTLEDTSSPCLGTDGQTSLDGPLLGVDDDDVSPNVIKFRASISIAILDASVLASAFLANVGCVA